MIDAKDICTKWVSIYMVVNSPCYHGDQYLKIWSKKFTTYSQIHQLSIQTSKLLIFFCFIPMEIRHKSQFIWLAQFPAKTLVCPYLCKTVYIHMYLFRFCFIFPTTRFLNMYLQVLAVVVLSIFAQTLITPFSMHLDSALSFKL